MNTPVHQFSELFAQLGLPTAEQEIRGFVAAHSPLAADIALADAPFWTQAQAAFLQEEILKDADWAELIDQLNMSLRAAPSAGV